MCSIFGSLKTNPSIGLHKYHYANSLMSHRGPDATNYYNDEKVYFGSNRLRIYDQSIQADQPMNILGRYIIIFNGSIYNFNEIKRDLSFKYKFHTSSDTEVIGVGYAEYGNEIFEKLNGMWALSIWDKKEQELILSRDRFGEKPLFYTENKDGFFYSSEMKSLLMFLQNKEINENIFKKIKSDWQYSFKYEATKETLVKNIYKILPGKILIIKNNQKKIINYYSPNNINFNKDEYGVKKKKYLNLFKSGLNDIVNCDTNLAFSLSGGIDSSFILNQLSDNYKKKYHFFTSYYDEQISNIEKNNIDTLKKKFNINHTFIPSFKKNENYERLVEKRFHYAEEIYPIYDLNHFHFYKNIKKTHSVIVDGSGPDEIFGGYYDDRKYLILDLIKDLNLNMVFKFLKKLKKSENFQNSFKRSNFSIVRDFINDFKNSNRSFSKIKFPKEISSYFIKSLFYTTNITMLPTLLRTYDRYSSSNGVENRMPFLNKNLIEFSYFLCAEDENLNISKPFLRNNLRESNIEGFDYKISKLGFSSNYQDFLNNKEFYLDNLNSSEFKNNNFISTKIKKKFENLSSQSNFDKIDKTLLWFELNKVFWNKYFFSNQQFEKKQ